LSTSQVNTKRNLFSTILAWILALLFIGSAIGVVFTYFPIGRLLDAEFYQQALEDVRIYQRLPETIAKQLATNLTPTPGETDSRIPFMVLNEQEWEIILVDLIDPFWLQSQSEHILDQVFEILLVSPDPVNTPLEISVKAVKQSLAGPDGVHALNQIIEAQPPCSLDQLLGLVQTGLGMENSISSLLCRPPDFIIAELNPFVESFLVTTVGQLPDQLEFFLPFSTLESYTEGIALESNLGDIPEPVRILRQANSLISWLPLLPVIFLLLLTLVVVRSLRDFMVWWGSSMFAAGIISLVFTFILVPAAKWALATYFPLDLDGLISMPEFLVQVGFTDLYSELVNQLLMSVIIPASTLTAVGFALLLGAYLLSWNTPNRKPQAIHPSDQVNSNTTA
jgi:hypothetical protein